MNIQELLRLAFTSIWSHKLRSFLTLVGIIAGVASIIAVMTGISVIQNTIEDEMSVLGSTTFQVQKYAAGGVNLTEEQRRKINRRRPTTVEHANAIRDKVKTIDLVGSELWDFGHTVKYRDISTNPNITICGGTPEYAPNNTHLIEYGRNISHEDVKVGRSVTVIGYAIAQKLFPWTDPINQVIKMDGHKFTVVGVFEEKKSAFGGGYDNYFLMPITKFKRTQGKFRFGQLRSVNITVRAKSPELLQDAVEETRAVMRQERGLKIYEEDDFTIFTNDSQIKTFNKTTAGVKAGAFVIGIIALIVAGIGIMNIMLVSVTERTREIGVRKSLGAKRKNILNQFLLEGIILSNIGGAIGVLVGFGLGNIVSLMFGFSISIPLNWAIVGLVFCTVIGITFGYWPAYKASKLSPIESLRYE